MQARVSAALGTKSRVGPHLAVPAAQNLLDGSKGVLGLSSGDQLSGLSWGRDGSAVNGVSQNSVVTFSVDNFTLGLPGSAVESAGGSLPDATAAGDILKTPELDPFGVQQWRAVPAPLGSNRMHIQEQQLGLWGPNSGTPSLISGGTLADNLRDFEHDNIRSYVDTDGDGMINTAAYFALDRNSPSVIAGLTKPGDILMSVWLTERQFRRGRAAGGFTFNVLATAASFGLMDSGGADGRGDGIDALILSRFADVPLRFPAVTRGFLARSILSVGGLPHSVPRRNYYTDLLARSNR